MTASRNKPTKEQLDKELEEYKDDPTFIRSEYIKLRNKGYPPERIDYDMCHIFR